MHPLIELVSEANAEVVYEEKDIDEAVSIVTYSIVFRQSHSTFRQSVIMHKFKLNLKSCM